MHKIIYNEKVWYALCVILSVIVFIVYLNSYKIGFYYDDYNYFRSYSNSEIIKTLTGDWNFGQRLENPGYRPLTSIIYHTLWNLLGTNLFYYRVINFLIVLMSGFLAYKIFSIYNKDKILITLGTILFLIFSDQFTHRIWLAEIPSVLSNVLALLGIYIVVQNYNVKNCVISYSLIIVASLIKETNLPFLILPILSEAFNKENYKVNYFVFIQVAFVTAFITAFVYIRSQAFNDLSEVIGVHSFNGMSQLIDRGKEFLTGFSPSLGLSPYSLSLIIFFLLGIFSLYIFAEAKIKKLSAKFYFISILIILSMAPFPFMAAGRLRVFFVCFTLLALLTFLSKVNKEKKFISYIFISFFIILNCIISYGISEKLFLNKKWLAQSVYFSPYFRSIIHQGDADKMLLYLEENDLDQELADGYNNLINSLTENIKIVKTGEFKDDLGIQFVSLQIGEKSKELNIMKYEFRREDLNKYIFNPQIGSKPNRIKPNLPVFGIRHYMIQGLIQHLNKMSKKYNYRLPRVQEYVWLTGGYKTIYEKKNTKLAAGNIKPVSNTAFNKFDIYGLNENVSEWTEDEINKNFAVIFGGNAHYGPNNIVFSDHKRKAKAGTAGLFGFRLIADAIN